MRRLSEGTLVEASVVARVLGLRILRLEATIALVPADPRARPRRPVARPPRALQEARRLLDEARHEPG